MAERATDTVEAVGDGVPDEGKRLLLLSENFYPTDSSGGRLLTALSEDLVASGLMVSVLTSFSVHSGKRTSRSRERYNGIEIGRVPALRLPRSNLLARLLNELSLTLFILFSALSKRRFDCIMVTSSPPFLAAAAALVASVRGVPLIYVVMDVYPDMVAATGHLRRESLAFKLWDRLSSYALSRSSRIVVLGRCMREVIRAKLQQSPPIEVLPNWADGEEIFPLAEDSNRFLASHPDLNGRFIVQYSGNLGRFHDFETILGAAERLQERADIRFVIIGNGARKGWLEAEVRSRNLENVLLLPFQPQEELNHSLNAQSVSLVTLERGTEGLCVPSKFYPVLAAGKPVIAVMDRSAEVARVVQEEGVGYAVGQHDVDGLVNAIEELAASPDLCLQLGKHARSVQQQKFDRRQASKRYLELIRSVTAEKAKSVVRREGGVQGQPQ